jgi:hypothetical protein
MGTHTEEKEKKNGCTAHDMTTPGAHKMTQGASSVVAKPLMLTSSRRRDVHPWLKMLT